MKCPHCGEFIPMDLSQPLVRRPDPTPVRWPLAKEFMSLVWMLDGSVLDATLLCMLAEDYVLKRRSSYRDLATRSNGAFGRAVIQRSLERLKAHVADGRVARLIDPGDDEDDQVRVVNLTLLRRLVTEQSDEFDAIFLWLQELADDNFRNALVLFLLLQAGADRKPQKLTGWKTVKLSGGVYAHPGELIRSLRSLAPVHGGGLVQRPEYRYWSIDSRMMNELLAQRAQTWLARGATPDPWEAGLQLALAEGSSPEAGAA